MVDVDFGRDQTLLRNRRRRESSVDGPGSRGRGRLRPLPLPRVPLRVAGPHETRAALSDLRGFGAAAKSADRRDERPEWGPDSGAAGRRRQADEHVRPQLRPGANPQWPALPPPRPHRGYRSQKRRTVHPALLSYSFTCASRATFESSFTCQNSRLSRRESRRMPTGRPRQSAQGAARTPGSQMGFRPDPPPRTPGHRPSKGSRTGLRLM